MYGAAAGGRAGAWSWPALFIWVLLASGSAWIMGAGRAQAAACLDGGGPPVLGRISERTGVPVVMALVSGAAALATMLAAMCGHPRRWPAVLLGGATVSIALIVLAYLFIFPAFVRLRYTHPGSIGLPRTGRDGGCLGR